MTDGTCRWCRSPNICGDHGCQNMAELWARPAASADTQTNTNESYASWHQRKGAAGVEAIAGPKWFICGVGTQCDENGLPTHLSICPRDGVGLTVIYLRADLALAAATGTAKTAKLAECGASQSGPKGNAQTQSGDTH